MKWYTYVCRGHHKYRIGEETGERVRASNMRAWLYVFAFVFGIRIGHSIQLKNEWIYSAVPFLKWVFIFSFKRNFIKITFDRTAAFQRFLFVPSTKPKPIPFSWRINAVELNWNASKSSLLNTDESTRVHHTHSHAHTHTRAATKKISNFIWRWASSSRRIPFVCRRKEKNASDADEWNA